jgi:hypothetical protein
MLMTGSRVSDKSLIVIRDHSTLSVVKGGNVTVLPSSVTGSLVIVVGVGSVYGGNTTEQGTEVHVTTGELTSQTSLNVMYEPLTADKVDVVDDACEEPSSVATSLGVTLVPSSLVKTDVNIGSVVKVDVRTVEVLL